MKKLIHGGDYNPEQWLDRPDIIDEDMRLMKKAGMNSASIGIFSWAILEPEEGKYDFSFLDMIMDKLHQNGIGAVLATPSGARPRWLAEKYPEVLRVNERGEKLYFGARHNHCHSSPIFREKITALNTALAERYKNHPALEMWHVSNELSGGCYCENCRRGFRDWLKKEFDGDLDRLNHEWWTDFWSHRYTSWEQVEPPSPLGDLNCVHGLSLAWGRYLTALVCDYVRAEAAPLRRITPDVPITVNMMQLFNGFDYQMLKNEVDIISWDNYPHWHSTGSDAEEALSTAFCHDWFRSMKNKPFLLMESTPSLTNWHEYNRPKRPGMHKLSSLQAIAHGSDSVQYFQWRKGRGSAEKFHGAVIDHNGRSDTRVFREVAELGKILNGLNDIAGVVENAQAAVIFDMQNRWAIEGAQCLCNKDKKYLDIVMDHYRALRKLGVSVDVIDPGHDLSGYKLVCAPMLYMTSGETIDRLYNFVKNGGILVSGFFSGVVNENDLCYLGGCPADKLQEVFGLWAEEIDTLLPDERKRVSGGHTARDYCEVIHPETAEVLASYCEDYYADTAAACVNSCGRGKGYYIAYRDCGSLLDSLYNELTHGLDIPRLNTPLPDGVWMQTRGRYMFIGNYTDSEIMLPDREVTLAPYGCEILTMDDI